MTNFEVLLRRLNGIKEPPLRYPQEFLNEMLDASGATIEMDCGEPYSIVIPAHTGLVGFLEWGCRACDCLDSGSSHAGDDSQPGSSAVDHPAHYNHGRYEPIDVIEDWGLGFNLGNTVKYVSRAGYKGDDVEDLEKASWYLRREIDRRTRERKSRCANDRS